MRNFFIIVMGLFFSVVSSASTEQDITDFKVAYAQFNEHHEKGDVRGSIPFAITSYKLSLKIYGDSHKNTATLAYNYATALLVTNSFRGASSVFGKTLKLYENVYGDDAEELLPVLIDLAEAKLKGFSQPKVTSYYNRALSITEDVYGDESLQYARVSIDAGALLLDRMNFSAAHKYLKTSYKLYSKILGEDDPTTGLAAFYLGKAKLHKKDYEDSIPYLEKALKTHQDPDKPSNVVEISAHGFLVAAYSKLDMDDKATKHCLAIGRMTPITSAQKYKPLVKEVPKYPWDARKKGIWGHAIAEYDVDESGFVRNVEVVSWSGHESFIETSRVAAEQFRYAPAFKNGKPVTTKGVQNRFLYQLSY